MYKGQKQLFCNLFSNYFVSLSPHITLILATGTFLSAGRKSSQTVATALYSSVCEYYVQIASPRVCVEFAAFQCRLATRLAPKWEQPYSRATVVGSLEITVCDHPCRWYETARHHRSVFGFSAASNRLFFLIGPLVWAEYALTQQSAQFTFPAELPASSAICTHTYCCTCLRGMHILRSRLWVFPPLPLLSYQ